MIKIKVYPGICSHVVKGNDHLPVQDYTYCVYLFGILVHAVTVYNLDDKVARQVFGKYFPRRIRMTYYPIGTDE